MSVYVVSPGSLSPAIYVGRANSAGDAFIDKTDRTDMVLAAVAGYVREHFDGGLEVTFPGMNVTMEVRVKTTGEQRP